jgi:hypothetical protein
MKSLIEIAHCMLIDIGMRCGADTQRDYKTVVSRVKEEGISFLTITLSEMGTALDRGLDTGHLDRRLLKAFKPSKGAPRIPALLQGIWIQIFDGSTGELLNMPSHEAILCMRQFCFMWKKIEVPCAEWRTDAAFQAYVKCDNELDKHFKELSTYGKEDLEDFRLMAAFLWSDVLKKVAHKIVNHELPMRHGPGATAEKLKKNERYQLPKWHKRLEQHFPIDVYGLFNHTFHEELHAVEFVEPDMEQPVRVVSVPKTLKSPRIIAIEPSCMQYAQQGLMTTFVDAIEYDSLLGGHVNFTDQTINQYEARESSESRRHTTMDLSEASDRVHNDLVLLLLGSNRIVSDAVQACRSTKAELPTGQIITLKKFASMGSATCFPIEAMVFFTIMVLAEARERYSLLPGALKYHKYEDIEGTISCCLRRSGLYVYGDDIIIPRYTARACADLLETFGLKVNRKKTFSRGYFRESCGEEYYNGTRVTPTYVRCLLPTSKRQSPSDWWSVVSTANQLYKAGFWTTCSYIREATERKLGKLPTVTATSSALGWNCYNNGYSIERWDQELHRWLVYSYKLKTRKQDDTMTDHSAMLKWALAPNRKVADKDHYKKTVRRGDVTSFRRWSTPY